MSCCNFQGKISSLGTGDQSVDICPLVSRATLDVLLRCALSYVDEGIQSTDRYMSWSTGFPTGMYVRPAKFQISLQTHVI